MGSKGLWRNVEGKTVGPKPYKIFNGEYVLADLKTPATEEQVEQKESKIAEYGKREYLAQHIIPSTTLTHLGAKIMDLTSANDMWKIVVADAMMKSTIPN